jgi:ArsR family transcriptional regulator
MHTSELLERFFKTLGDANRIRILNLLLSAGELCVCDIERVLALPQSRVSRHLTLLRLEGLVVAERHGQWMHYRMAPFDGARAVLLDALHAACAGSRELQADLSTLRSCKTLVCTPLSISLPGARTQASRTQTAGTQSARTRKAVRP